MQLLATQQTVEVLGVFIAAQLALWFCKAELDREKQVESEDEALRLARGKDALPLLDERAGRRASTAAVTVTSVLRGLATDLQELLARAKGVFEKAREAQKERKAAQSAVNAVAFAHSLSKFVGAFVS